MSLFSQTQTCLRLVQRSLFVSQKRFNVRQSIHRHTEPHKFKKHMLAACEPYFKRVIKLPEETCKGSEKAQVDLHPLEKILVKELLDIVKNSDYVLFIQYNYTKFQSERVYKNTIIKLGGTFHALNNNIYRETFKILNYTDVNGLFITRNALITGKVESLPACVKALRKMPQLLLLGGFIDGHLYEIDQLKSISLSNNLDTCRANLLATLESPAISLSHYLKLYKE